MRIQIFVTVSGCLYKERCDEFSSDCPVASIFLLPQKSLLTRNIIFIRHSKTDFDTRLVTLIDCLNEAKSLKNSDSSSD